ncbi:MAG: hypothetical protein AAB316_23765, partial [Bacteroidota bacterium]
MFQKSFFRTLFAAAFAGILNTAFALVPPSQTITLRAGTAVSLTLNETFTAEDVAVGNAIDFLVRSDVTVAGQVVIAAGSIAEGWVKKVETNCNGNCNGCATITITVERVQAVDGQMVNLRSVPHVIKAPCCVGTATANIGTNLSARVLNDIKINAYPPAIDPEKPSFLPFSTSPFTLAGKQRPARPGGKLLRRQARRCLVRFFKKINRHENFRLMFL